MKHHDFGTDGMHENQRHVLGNSYWNDAFDLSSDNTVLGLNGCTRYTSKTSNRNTLFDTVSLLSKTEGITSVRRLDDLLMHDIINEEMKVHLAGGMLYDNRALDECCVRNTAICVFCNGFIEEQTEISMIMMDNYGNITGNDVPKCKEAEYRSRNDVIWLSDNFVLYTKAVQRSESRLVMMPRRFRSLENMNGVSNAICFYPSLTTDIMLKKRFMDEYDPKLCSLIVGFDIIQ
jgi:hypothetical protein